MENKDELFRILFHTGEARESYFGAVNPPVFATSNFTAPDVQSLRSRIQDEFRYPFYTRGFHPTQAIVRQKLAALEETEDALLTGSGSAAIALAVISVLKAGDHAVIPTKPYSWTHFLFHTFLARYGVSCTAVDPTNAQNYRNAIQANTRLLYLETPNSMTFEITDMQAVTSIAREKGIVTIIDNSYSTPLFQQPARWGVDLVVHSATKYLGGHSDFVGGVVCGPKVLIDPMFRNDFMVLGGILSPENTQTLLKGLRTLDLRMNRVSETAEKLATYLNQHPGVQKVYHPFLPEFSGSSVAKRQMQRASGLFSIALKAQSFEEIEQIVNRLNHFFLATSWGGYESLVFPAAAFRETAENWDMAIPWNLVRISVGLEDADVLIRDWKNALEANG